MLVAVFPALMYFFSVFVMVHYEAKKHNIVGEKSEYSAMEILKKEWFYILPLVLINRFSCLRVFRLDTLPLWDFLAVLPSVGSEKIPRIGPKRL